MENKLCFFEDLSSDNGEYNEQLENHRAKSFSFLVFPDEQFQKINEGKWLEVIEGECFKHFLATGSDTFNENEKLAVSIASLLAFVQDNFTGPDLFLLSDSIKFQKTFENMHERWNAEGIAVDGIEINPNVRNVPLLIIAKNFLEDLLELHPSDLVSSTFDTCCYLLIGVHDFQIICIWYLRMIKVYQMSIDEDSATLYEKLQSVSCVLTMEKLQEMANLRIRILIQLEVISMYLLYRRVQKVDELLKQLKESSQIEMIEEGLLGMRTKWQQKPLPQFHISILQTNNEVAVSSKDTHGETKLTELLKLDDDTRLETIKFLDDKQNEQQQLSSTIQNLLLINVRHLEISQPKDNLADEEVKPYLMLLLKQENGPWILRLNALLMHIKLESNHRRTVERSLRQCEEMVAMLNSKAGEYATPRQRLSYVFSSLMYPRFKIEAQLADLMVSLGLIKGALDVYLRIKHWEEVIQCYTQLELRHKAAEIIKQELEKRPTVKLHCLLGDATDDISCYEKAWDFSKHRSGLAQRHWGNYFYFKKEYEKAIPHFQKSLEINSLQENIWLRLGYSALIIDKYELASSAYIRYTQLEPSGFESWNNLAKCFIKLGDKKRAHKVLQEALKCNFDNWKIWENFLLVSLDVGSFGDALNAYNRLIELKEKYFDEEVLKILMNAIANDLPDAEGYSANRLKKNAMKMLAHLGSIHGNEGIVWELSANLSDVPLQQAQKLQKAHKGYVSVSNILKSCVNKIM